jgi:hypothetical protein
VPRRSVADRSTEAPRRRESTRDPVKFAKLQLQHLAEAGPARCLVHTVEVAGAPCPRCGAPADEPGVWLALAPPRATAVNSTEEA